MLHHAVYVHKARGQDWVVCSAALEARLRKPGLCEASSPCDACLGTFEGQAQHAASECQLLLYSVQLKADKQQGQ